MNNQLSFCYAANTQLQPYNHHFSMDDTLHRAINIMHINECNSITGKLTGTVITFRIELPFIDGQDDGVLPPWYMELYNQYATFDISSGAYNNYYDSVIINSKIIRHPEGVRMVLSFQLNLSSQSSQDLSDIVWQHFTAVAQYIEIPPSVLNEVTLQAAINVPQVRKHIPIKKPQALPPPEFDKTSPGIHHLYRVNAFTYDNEKTGEHYQGNPAIVVMSHGDFPSKEDIKRICLLHDKPITTLIKEVKDESGKKIYDIRYYFPDGTEVSLCGHATVAATQLLKQLGKVKNGNTIEFRPNPILLKETVTTAITKDDIAITLPSYKQENLDLQENKDTIQKILSCFFDNVPEDEEAFYTFLSDKNITGLKYNPILKDYIFIMSDAAHMHECRMNNDTFSAFKNDQIAKGNNFRAVFFTAPIAKELGHDGIQTRCLVPSTDPGRCFEDLACGSFNSADNDIFEDLEHQGLLAKKPSMTNIYPLATNTKGNVHGKDMGGFQKIRFAEGHHNTVELVCKARGARLRQPTYKLENTDPDTSMHIQLVPMQPELIEDLHRLQITARYANEHTLQQLFGPTDTLTIEKLVHAHTQFTCNIHNGIGFYNVFIQDINGHMKFAGIAGSQLLHDGKKLTPDIQYALLPGLKGREAHVYPKLVIQTLIEDLQKRGYETCSVHTAADHFDAKKICEELGLSYAGNPDLNIARFDIALQKHPDIKPVLSELNNGIAFALWLSMKAYIKLPQEIGTHLVHPAADKWTAIAPSQPFPFLTI